MQFIGLFNKFGILAVLVLVMLEYACFPIPSEIVLPFVGFVANLNEYNLIGTILMSIIFSYFGCLVCYLVGYYGGGYFYNKIYNKFKKWQKGMDIASNKFTKYGGLSVFLCRLIPLCRTYVSFLAGVFKQDLIKYSFYSICGIFVWNSILIVVGYCLSDKWYLIEGFYGKYKLIMIGVVFIIFLFFVYKLYKKKKITKNINGD